MPPKKRPRVVKDEEDEAEVQQEPQPTTRTDAIRQEPQVAIPVEVAVPQVGQQLAPRIAPAPVRPDAKRSENFYFATGDVALIATDFDDTPPVVFRVEKAVLSRYSSVFAEMFQSLAAPGTHGEEYDGVPLVALRTDSHYDIADLLRFMYDPASLLKWLEDAISPSFDVGLEMERLLCTAVKYKVEGVQPFVLRILEHHWPRSLTDWLRKYAEFSQLQNLWALGCASLQIAYPDVLYMPDAASTVLIGLKHNIPSILPAAFYTLASIDFQDDWDRYNTMDASRWSYHESEDMRATNPTDCWRRTARWRLLDKGPMMKLLLGKQALAARRAVLGRVYKVEIPAEAAHLHRRCQDLLPRLAENYNAKFEGSGPCEPLQALLRMLNTIQMNPRLCEPCRAAVRTNINAEMEKLWDGLWEMFSLDQP